MCVCVCVTVWASFSSTRLALSLDEIGPFIFGPFIFPYLLILKLTCAQNMSLKWTVGFLEASDCHKIIAHSEVIASSVAFLELHPFSRDHLDAI